MVLDQIFDRKKTVKNRKNLEENFRKKTFLARQKGQNLAIIEAPFKHFKPKVLRGNAWKIARIDERNF